MEILANQNEPAGFRQIQQAFDTARQLSCWKPRLVKVGVCRSDGNLAAIGVFHDQRQARLFAIQMGGLGYRQLDESMDDCELTFVPERWTAEQTLPDRLCEPA
ncbi:hypothetical protein [Ramlibacter sp.]|uniref:hypothetical protein n=1 Tax=Ramlibacter sp. TaxID=1917967 RepID=UPI003D118CC3